MDKLFLVIDVARCEDCNNCFLACKDEHVDNDFPPYSVAQPRHGQRWMNIITKERGQCPRVDVASLPVPCMHCDDAPCLKKASEGAIYKTGSGIVIIDPVKARGQPDLVNACPYGVIWWNEARNVAQKCTLCAHLIHEGWKEPRCVQACPTGALRIFKTDDARMKAIIAEEKLEVLHPEYRTRPRVYYKNLSRFTRCFISGDVAFNNAGVIDCAAGAEVALFKDLIKIAAAITDNYGDFKFDGLQENSGTHFIEVVFKDYPKQTMAVELDTSKNVGTVLF
jgi:Fe-S-cluster-containing dehydrogenase component